MVILLNWDVIKTYNSKIYNVEVYKCKSHGLMDTKVSEFYSLDMNCFYL